MVVVRLEIFSVIIFSTFSFSQLLQATTARQKTRALAPRAQIYQCLPLQRDVLGRLERGLEKLALRAAVLTVSPQLGGDEYLQEKFMLHFKENTPETRRIVGQRFQAIAAEARSSGGGSVPITCIDLQERCRDNFQYAYVDDTGYILCPLFYRLPPYEPEYYDPDRMSVLVREICRLRSIHNTPTMTISPRPPEGPLWEGVTAQEARQNGNAYGFFVKDLLGWFVRRRRDRQQIQATVGS